jgi:hypothetical protein
MLFNAFTMLFNAFTVLFNAFSMLLPCPSAALPRLPFRSPSAAFREAFRTFREQPSRVMAHFGSIYICCDFGPIWVHLATKMSLIFTKPFRAPSQTFRALPRPSAPFRRIF